MLQQLIAKVERAATQCRRDLFRRLTPIKEDLMRLDDLRTYLPPEYFDGAILINVLYAVDDPVECLRQVHRLLAPAGHLVLSTRHRGTDVDRLFDRMRQVLENKGLFGQLRRHFFDARARHESMEQRIHRDTKDDIRQYVKEAGFHIQECRDEYVDAVVVLDAMKR